MATHTEYMREYTRRNKDRINTQRRERRIKLGDDALEYQREQGRVRNRRYHGAHRDEIVERGHVARSVYDA